MIIDYHIPGSPRAFRSGVRSRVPALLALLALCVGPSAAQAQIRPLDPIAWRDFRLPLGAASVGAAIYSAQPASLAGVEGRMVELGSLRGVVRVGRVLFEASGSAWRMLDERISLNDPVSGVRDAVEGRRADVGDYRFSTMVLLTEPRSAWGAAFRFGARLPTTDETAGLERDETDVFFTVATQWQSSHVRLFAEGGLGIFGVVSTVPDQTDPFLYMAGIQMPRSTITAGLELVGHYDTRHAGPPRGNEHLSELRLRVRSEGATWGELVALRGLASFSPDYGLELRIGRTF